MKTWESIEAMSSAAGLWNKWIVAIYKALGFAVLVAILCGICAYLGLQLFFFLDRGWMVPSVISPTDPKVLQANTQVAQESMLRDKLHAERLDLLARKAALERAIVVEEAFQRRIRKAVAADLGLKRSELARLRELSQRAGTSRREIERANRAYAGMSRDRLRELYRARLIDKDAYVAGHHQLADLELTNLSLAERTVALEQNMTALRAHSAALSGVAADLRREESPETEPGAEGEPPLTYELLGIRREYDRSRAEVIKAQDELASVQASLAAVDGALKRHERLVRALSESPFLKAWEHSMVAAFVPYENASNARVGNDVYGCRLAVLVCRKVGRVASVLPGEATAAHPIRSQQIRGLLLELELHDRTAVGDRVLHVGGAPLLL